MRFGHFDDAAREYVIERPDTPLPWINYLGTEDFFGIVSQTAGGYAFYRDARLRRLTRYRYNSAPFDTGGRCLYLRDDRHGRVHWQPTREPEGYAAATGSATRRSARSARASRPRRSTSSRWARRSRCGALRVSNRRDRAARLSLFSAVEFCLWDALDDATNFQRNFSIGEVEVEDGVIYHKTEYRERRDHFAYFACSRAARRLRHAARRVPRPVPRLGRTDGGRARALRRLDRARLGADRRAPGAS